MVDKFSDSYEAVFDCGSDFLDELHERQQKTERCAVDPGGIHFLYGSLDGEAMRFQHLENDAVICETADMDEDTKGMWSSPEVQEIGLFIRFQDGNGCAKTFPLSQNCKLSLNNRTGLTFNGELNIPINKIALARLYEDFISREAKKEQIQVISVYGKVQAIMTNVYSPIEHDQFFEKIDKKVHQKFEKTAVLRKGYIGPKWSRGIWYIGKLQSETDSQSPCLVELGLSAMDSQTGHSGAILQPCLFAGKKKQEMLFDDAWYSKHMSLTEEGINDALDSVYLQLNDNAQRLIDTMEIDLENPAQYARNLTAELNKLAKKMSGTKLSAKVIASFVSSIEGLSFIRSKMSVWDVIELLWDIPANNASSQKHKDELMKTVSRVLVMNHAALDAA